MLLDRDNKINVFRGYRKRSVSRMKWVKEKNYKKIPV